MNLEHTPLPLKAYELNGIVDADGLVVLRIHGQRLYAKGQAVCETETAAVQEAIVEAVNNHKKLVLAARCALADFEGLVEAGDIEIENYPEISKTMDELMDVIGEPETEETKPPWES